MTPGKYDKACFLGDVSETHMCVYICVVCIHICLFVCMYVFMHVGFSCVRNIYVYVCLCVYVIHVYMVYPHVHVYVHVCMSYRTQPEKFTGYNVVSAS